ncbi:hypothetical protein D7X88_18940 [bacterium C-53]|nr:hypothetical protein [Lachnospiraceae bacterium]NBI04990.1 hypothetical protein [Lachnospiraceae bacterium]RKJ07501.1 hypothetical protein D7X88_18940 [bacterium C-53]
MDCFDILKKRETRDQLNAGYIYIPEITTYELIYSDITSYLIANTIAKKTQCQVVRLIDQYDNNEKSKFAEKFGFCTEHTRLKGMAGAVNRLKTLFHTLYVFFTCHTGDKLLQVQIDRIPIGKYIYDSIVRTQDRNTIDRVIIWKDFKEIYNAVALFYNLKKIYQRQKPKYVILNESSYLLNLCRVLAQKHNASIIIASTIMIKIENDNMLGFLDGFYQELVSDKLKEMGGINHVEYAERYFCNLNCKPSFPSKGESPVQTE